MGLPANGKQHAFLFSTPIPQIQNNANAIGQKASARTHFQWSSISEQLLLFFEFYKHIEIVICLHSDNILFVILLVNL